MKDTALRREVLLLLEAFVGLSAPQIAASVRASLSEAHHRATLQARVHDELRCLIRAGILRCDTSGTYAIANALGQRIQTRSVRRVVSNTRLTID